MSSKPIVDPNSVYSRAEAAHVLGVSLTTLKQLIRAGHLAVSRPEGIRRVFIKGASILEMLDRTMLPATVPATQTNFVPQSIGASKSFAAATIPLNEYGNLTWQNKSNNNLALRDASITRSGAVPPRNGKGGARR